MAVMDHDGSRKADLAAIHIAKASLGMDEDTYRDVLFTVCRVRSSAQLDFTGRKTFLAHLRACQAQLGPHQAPALKRAAWSPSHGRLWSLWQQLADHRLVESRDRSALSAWVKRQTGVDRIEWLNAAQLDLCIDSAKRWLSRKSEG